MRLLKTVKPHRVVPARKIRRKLSAEKRLQKKKAVEQKRIKLLPVVEKTMKRIASRHSFSFAYQLAQAIARAPEIRALGLSNVEIEVILSMIKKKKAIPLSALEVVGEGKVIRYSEKTKKRAIDYFLSVKGQYGALTRAAEKFSITPGILSIWVKQAKKRKK